MNIDMPFNVNIISDDSDSDLEDLNDFINIVHRRPRILHRRANHLNYWDDEDFINRFRLSKNTVQNLLNEIQENIRYPTERNSALNPLQQLLLTLRFYATGSFQRSLGDLGGIHQSTACKIIKRVTTQLCLLKPNYIRLPQDDEIIAMQQGFMNIAGFPRVTVVVDGTHVRIQNPGGDQAEWFRNRKGFFSINTVIACDHQLKIRNIVARWPGASNDMNVFMNSNLKAQFENGMENCLILGDSGYALERYFMVPLENPITPGEMQYQASFIRTRNVVERCIGVWKRRFPCLSLGLRTKIPTTQDVIVATSILHNIAIIQRQPEPIINAEVEALINNNVPQNIVKNDNDFYRRQLIDNYFARV